MAKLPCFEPKLGRFSKPPSRERGVAKPIFEPSTQLSKKALILEPKRGLSKPSFSSREAGLGSHPSRERERRLTKTPSGVFSKPQSEGIDTQSLSALCEQSFQKATNMPASYDRAEAARRSACLPTSPAPRDKIVLTPSTHPAWFRVW